MSNSVWSAVRRAYASGVLDMGYPFAGSVRYVGTGAPIGVTKYNTIQEMLNAAVSRDLCIIGPNPDGYDEAVTLAAGADNLTIVGMGNRGAVAIAPAAANAKALTINGDGATRINDLTLINIGLEGNGTGGGLHVKGNIRRIRAYGCKFEGGAFAAKLESTANGSVGDTILDDVELAWATDALLIDVSGAGNPVTQTRLKNSLLHNYSSRGVRVVNAFSADLWITKNIFARQEDGTQPTNEYIKADFAGTTGFVAENSFATPTNAIGKLAIAAGVIWGPNGTEAGWSSARPA